MTTASPAVARRTRTDWAGLGWLFLFFWYFSGVTQALIEVAKDLPRKGPSGTYSQAWMSRADQSLRPTTPKVWRAKSAVPTLSPMAVGTPTTKPSSASMSSRCDGP